MPWNEDYDIGQKNGSWADTGLDDSGWKTVQVPGDFKELGVAGVPSLTYLRKEVTIPDPVPQGRAGIYLGQVEKMDTVYVNGRQVGSRVPGSRIRGSMALSQPRGRHHDHAQNSCHGAGRTGNAIGPFQCVQNRAGWIKVLHDGNTNNVTMASRQE